MSSTKKVKQQKEKEPPITKDILMGDLVQRFPQTAEILQQYGFHCVGCMISPFETLEAGAVVHGIQLEPLLIELNTAVGGTERAS